MAPQRAGRLRRDLPLLAVATLLAAGIVVTALPVPVDSYRPGGVLVASALALAAILRAVLPARRIGMLTARSRAFDVALLALSAAAVIALALTIPGTPPAS